MTTSSISEVSDASFAHDVLERSKDLPVVVDFWAPWCGPCRLLGPVLEKVAGDYDGQMQLVKVNTDENPQVALRYQIQGIPAVIAFRDGEPVNQFVGALPEEKVRQFFKSVVPSGGDQKAAEAAELLRAGQPGEARSRYEAALAEDSQNKDAALGLAALLATAGEYERAIELASKWPNEASAKRVLGVARFQRAASEVDQAAMEARLAADADDAEAHYRLGIALGAQRRWRDALEHLLTSVQLDRSLDDEAARRSLLDAFAILGDENELTREYRRKLGAVLF